MIVHSEIPDMPNGTGQPEQAAPLLGQQRVRLLACATCLLLVGGQAPGSTVGGFGQEGRVLLQTEGSLDDTLGSPGQPSRMLRSSLAGEGTADFGSARDSLAAEGVLSSQEDASLHWRRQVLDAEELRRLEGRHRLPKWVRWAATSILFRLLR